MQIKQLKSTDVKALREKLLKEQGGVCAICGEVPKIACLDHSHTRRVKGTGLVRGVLCNGCNTLLGKMENSCVRTGTPQHKLPKILGRMKKFLRLEHLPYMHPSEAPRPKRLTKRSYNTLHKSYKLSPVRAAFPAFPKRGKLTKPLDAMYRYYGIVPEFYD